MNSAIINDKPESHSLGNIIFLITLLSQGITHSRNKIPTLHAADLRFGRCIKSIVAFGMIKQRLNKIPLNLITHRP